MTAPSLSHLTRKDRNVHAEVREAITKAHEAHASMPNVPVPAGKLGDVEIVRYTLPLVQALSDAHEAVLLGFPEMTALPNIEFTGMRIGGRMFMSDTPMEKLTNQAFVNAARGDVLIFGLGIGLILTPILENPEVRSVTVVELNPDVIGLVAHHYTDRYPHLVVVQGDAFTWEPPSGALPYDTIYFDIWPDIGDTNLPAMAQLMERGQPWLAEGGWMDCWMREKSEWMRDVHEEIGDDDDA